MKKSFKLLAMVSVLSLLFISACGNNDETESEKQLRMAMVLNGPVSDGGWNADCYQGMLEAQEKLGFEITFSENVGQSDYVSAFRQYAAEGYDLVFAPGSEFSDAIQQINKDYPEVMFAGIQCTFTDDNVSSLNTDNIEAGFLAGALAGLMTESNVVGFVGGTEIPPITTAIKGMEQGLAYINPEAEMIVTMAGSWDDIAKGKEIALSQASTANVDVIFGFASAVNAGIIEGAKEKGIYVIGEPNDQLDLAPDTVLSSVILSNPDLVMYAAQKVHDNTFEGEYMVGGIASGMVGMGRYSDKVPAEVQTQMEQIMQDLVADNIPLER